MLLSLKEKNQRETTITIQKDKNIKNKIKLNRPRVRSLVCVWGGGWLGVERLDDSNIWLSF